jgi:hypothetical protein
MERKWHVSKADENKGKTILHKIRYRSYWGVSNEPTRKVCPCYEKHYLLRNFRRQWNEQKTVIDIWGHLEREPTPEPPPASPIMPTSMKTSRSVDSLYLDPTTGVVESSSKGTKFGQQM